jgi:hypothetical protein
MKDQVIEVLSLLPRIPSVPLGSLTLGEATGQVMRTFKELYKDIYMVRTREQLKPGGLLPTAI